MAEIVPKANVDAGFVPKTQTQFGERIGVVRLSVDFNAIGM